MKIRQTITKLLTITLAVAALAAVSYGWMPGPGAGGQVVMSDGSVRFISPSISFKAGQIIRLNVYSPSRANLQIATFYWGATILDANGNILARSEPVSLSSGQFRSVQFLRDDLHVQGEPVTGGLQVGCDFQFQADAQSVVLSSPVPFLISVEVIDTRTGGTRLASFYAYPGFNGGVFVGG